MNPNDLPAAGLAFLATASGEIIVRPGGTAHFELLPTAAGSDEWKAIEAWIRQARPRFGRVGVRGGRLDLLTLTKPTSAAVPASEEERRETDAGVRAMLLQKVISALDEL